MAVSSSTVTVTTSATLLATGTGVYPHLTRATVYNVSAQTVYTGGSGVTTAAGTPIAATTGERQYVLQKGETLYGIVAATTSDVRVETNGAS